MSERFWDQARRLRPERTSALTIVDDAPLYAEPGSRTAALALAVRELHAGLEELLDVAERIRGGDNGLDPERWYAARDYARLALKNAADPSQVQNSQPKSAE